MKNYKSLIPVVMVFLFALSCYMLVDSRMGDYREYESLLSQARDRRSQGILVDAEEEYLACMELHPTAELSREIGEFYWDARWTDDAFDWGEAMLEKYPDYLGGYEFLMQAYDNSADYIECFNLADRMREKKLSSPVTDEIMQRIQYYYYFNGKFDGAACFSDGRCAVRLKDHWGYIDSEGYMVCDPLFVEAGPLSEGLAPVIDERGEAYFVDPAGNKKHVVLNVDNVEKLGYLAYGIFPLYNGRTWGFYDLNHQHVFGEYEDVSSVGNYVAAVKEKGKWHLVDHTGRSLSDSTYQDVIQDGKSIVCRNDRLFVSDGKKVSMIDSAGTVIASYDDARLFLDTTLAAVKSGKKWGFADKDGNMVIKPQFEEAHSFSHGLAAVRQHGRWGFIDQTGKLVIPASFEDAGDFNPHGNACVQDENGKWRVLRLYQYNH